MGGWNKWKCKFLTIPYYPSNDDRGYNYTIYTVEEKLIIDYTGLNISEVSDLSYIKHKILLRDAFIFKQQQTEQGREYLKSAWILEQTNPDREELRKAFKWGD